MILVTGGAGYIGSQVVYQLLDAGERVLVLDNLQTGTRQSLEHVNCELVVGDIGDIDLLKQLFKRYDIEVVMHFAASTNVPESVQHPNKYYLNNVANTVRLLSLCEQCHLKHFIFSSTAAVYGNVNVPLVSETAACHPINPYGWSKWMAEKIIIDSAQAQKMNYIILRYFNVAGADPELRVGPYFFDGQVLIRQAVQVAHGLKERLFIYGDDYKTPDGTGVRDYIHVADIASAHIAALNHLRLGGKSTVLNCGYGQGYSVREVMNTIEQIAGKKLPVEIAPRRAGDPDCVLAETKRIHEILHWQPRYNDLNKIISDAFHWEGKLVRQWKG